MLASSSSLASDGGKSSSSTVSIASENSDNSLEHMRHSAIKDFQSRLVLLYHASNCPHSNATPAVPCRATPCCYDMLLLLKHVNNCDVSDCIVPHCVSTRYLLGHYRSCESANCVICKPLNDSIQRKRTRTRDVVIVRRRKRAGDNLEDMNDAVLEGSNHSVHSIRSDTELNLDGSTHGGSAPSSPATATMKARQQHLLSIPKLKEINKVTQGGIPSSSQLIQDLSNIHVSNMYPETSFETITPRDDSLFSPRDELTPYSAGPPPTRIPSKFPLNIPRLKEFVRPSSMSNETTQNNTNISHFNHSMTTNDTSYETITPRDRDEFIFTPRDDTPLSALPLKSFHLPLTATRSREVAARPVYTRPVIASLPIQSYSTNMESNFEIETPRDHHNDSMFSPRDETPLPTPRGMTTDLEPEIGFDTILNFLNEVTDPSFFPRSPQRLSPPPSLSSSSSFSKSKSGSTSAMFMPPPPPPYKDTTMASVYSCIKCTMTMLGGYRYHCERCNISFCARCFHCEDDIPHEHPLRAFLINNAAGFA